VVFPVNPKALDRARDRFRMSQAKSDPFDAQVLATFLRTDHAHLHALQPSSEAAQELKLLTRDYARLVREQTRLLNQLTVTLKEDSPRALELCPDLTTQRAWAFLRAYPTPAALAALTPKQWQRFAGSHHWSAEHATALWERIRAPQLPVPPHVVRAKSRLVGVVVTQLNGAVSAVADYREAVTDFSRPCRRRRGRRRCQPGTGSLCPPSGLSSGICRAVGPPGSISRAIAAWSP